MNSSPHVQSTSDSNNEVHLSVVSPVYGAKDCLQEFYRRVCAAAEKIGKDFEIILVDDASPDGSWAVIEGLSKKDTRVHGIQFTRNFGQHHAIAAGLRVSRGEWVVVMDCDLQDRPEDISLLYALACEGHECVMARRIGRQDPLFKRVSSWVFYRAFNYLTDLKYDGTVANFSIISRRVVEALNGMTESVRFYGGFLHYLGYTGSFVDVQHDPRYAGESSYTFLRLVRLAGYLIIAHSNKPLRLCVTAGFLISSLAFLAGVFSLSRVLLYGSPITGWPTLVISIFFSTGTIILTLGILGFYIGRILTEVKNRPLYVVKKQTFET